MEPKTIQEAFELSKRRHNARSMAGMTIRNATGDIDQASLGFQIVSDTLTYLRKQIIEQKFYEIAPADYVPISVGEGAFSQSILTNLAVNASRDFESGVINVGSANDKLDSVDAALTSKTVKVVNWAKATGYSIFEVEQALQSGNWDVIEQKHRARKKNWDLGIQQIAFLGMSSDQTNVPGLLTQTSSNVNSDVSTIQQLISSMDSSAFATFVKNIVAAYQANCNYTAFPTHFIIPQDDWLGLAVPVSTTNPINSKLEYLKKAFAEIVPGGVKMLPSPYSIPSFNSNILGGGAGLHRYCMYRYDQETLRMDIPVDFTATQPNTVNNFQFQDAAYGQFTGVGVYHPLEILYFDF